MIKHFPSSLVTSNKRIISIKSLIVVFVFASIFWGSGNKVLGQIVTEFSCAPNPTGNECRDFKVDARSSAVATFSCSNWVENQNATLSAINYEYCENGEFINNVSLVEKKLSWASGENESDSWDVVLRTVTAKAFFCDGTMEDYTVQRYPEGCDFPYPICDVEQQNICEAQCDVFDSANCSCKSAPAGECASPQAGCNCSPILIDVAGNGFELSGARNGVAFDLNGDGVKKGRFAWTLFDTDDAWLALDRNGNGNIDNGSELFGNYTPQPSVPQPHGFLALAEYDKPENGGDNNGLINDLDRIYPDLRLWQDSNRNGISEPNELKTLDELDLRVIRLDFKETKRQDQYGNKFKYRARVSDGKNANIGSFAWDVFLTWTEQ